jgi:hypothetical protein
VGQDVKPKRHLQAFEFPERLDRGSEQGLKMSADTFASRPRRRFEQPDHTVASSKLAAGAGSASYAGRCEAADADLRGIGLALYGASAVITVASVTWLALSFS